MNPMGVSGMNMGLPLPPEFLSYRLDPRATGCKLNIMEAPVARVSSPVRNSRHRDSAPVQPCVRGLSR